MRRKTKERKRGKAAGRSAIRKMLTKRRRAGFFLSTAGFFARMDIRGSARQLEAMQRSLTMFKTGSLADEKFISHAPIKSFPPKNML